MSLEPLPGETPLADACRWRGSLRDAGRRLAFTNGCFDVLHAGHVRLLVEARAAADALLVAINSDASVRALKGPGRPVVPASQRAVLLRALSAVDRVVTFDAPTPIDTIAALEPDVLVKGADWAEDEIIGAREVRARGGTVLRVPLEPGLSTSAIVDGILGADGRVRGSGRD